MLTEIAKAGIIGPHEGLEANLLAAGTKPVGLIAVPEHPEATQDPIFAKSFNDISVLDELVARGLLLKTIICGRPHGQLGSTFLGHFYCQPHKHSDMERLARAHEAYWANRSDSDASISPEEWGILFGYTNADVTLFNEDMRKNSQSLKWHFMSRTNGLRRRCRQYLMLRGIPAIEFEHAPQN